MTDRSSKATRTKAVSRGALMFRKNVQCPLLVTADIGRCGLAGWLRVTASGQLRSSFKTLITPTAIEAMPMPIQNAAVAEFIPATIQARPTPIMPREMR